MRLGYCCLVDLEVMIELRFIFNSSFASNIAPIHSFSVI